MGEYRLHDHWERVASEIAGRDPGNRVAGDDSPCTRYLREEFLADFRPVTRSFSGLKVLELGCGPGGNLMEAGRSGLAKLVGCDISAGMLRLARQNLTSFKSAVELCRIDGFHLPFVDRAFDASFTVTVLQHVTTDPHIRILLSELARVSSKRVLLYEDTHPWKRVKYSHVARRVATYREQMAEQGFTLSEVKHLSTAVSHVASSILRRLTAPRGRHEGEAFPQATLRAQALLLRFTRPFDYLIPVPAGLTKMIFVRG